MAERKKNLREELILAGIEEINIHGANGFSFRRVAEACHVSSAAPYKHFKDKKEFITAIIDYVNAQWRERQDQILAGCGGDLRRQIVESASPQLVPLEPPTVSEKQLCIQYRGAELKLPVGVDMDAVCAILRSLQSL